jgi:hypothetical protein
MPLRDSKFILFDAFESLARLLSLELLFLHLTQLIHCILLQDLHSRLSQVNDELYFSHSLTEFLLFPHLYSVRELL